jgi:hypothetical protein
MALWAKMRRDGTIRCQKALDIPWGFEPLHAPFPLAGRVVGILRTVVQIPVLPMFHTGQDLAHGRPIAFEVIRDDDPWDVPQPLEQPAEELLRGCLVPATLDQDIEDVALLVHGSQR